MNPRPNQNQLLGPPAAKAAARLITRAAIFTCLFLLPGCRTTIPARDHGPVIADAADESRVWAAVLPVEGSQTHADLLARRDDPAREAAASLPQGFWPDSPAPSLRRPIRIFIDRTPERSIFFRSERTEIRRWE